MTLKKCFIIFYTRLQRPPTNLNNKFQRRLTTQAAAELDQLTLMLQDVSLSTETDERSSYF
jgi:hypothetical protein